MSGMLTLLKMAMGFVIAKVVAIYTGPTGMAMLGQVQSMVTSVNGIVNSPASNGVVRYTAENIDKGFVFCAPFWRASVQWVLILLSIVIPVGLFFADQIALLLFQNSSLSWVVIISVCVLPLSAIASLFNSVINGQQQYKRYISLGLISVVFSSGMMLYLIIIDDMRGALLSASIQSALIGIVMLVANIREPWFKLTYWFGKTTEYRSISGYMCMAIVSSLAMPASLIAVRSFLIDGVGWNEAGQWQAVWKISEVYLGVITMALSTYYLPRLSSIANTDDILYEVKATARVVFPIVVGMGFGIFVAKDFIIQLVFTNQFLESRNLFAAQLGGDAVKILSWLYAYPMISKGRVKWFISTELLSSITFVGISYLLIGIFGLQGATLGYLCNYIVYFCFVRFNIKRILDESK
ncbi:MAG: O-antigen translocase [Shewanella sp.]